MEYSIKKLAQIAGISSRTLRYYDEIELLKPARINSSGYRIYGPNEVDRLQQILFYRELGLDLTSIKAILLEPSFDELQALKEHREKLLEKKIQLDLLLENVNKTISSKERRITMSDQEKFVGFKKKLIDENEKKYGKETREKYGDDEVNKSNNKISKMTEKEYDEITKLSNEINNLLKEVVQIGDPKSELALKLANLHKEWLTFYWNQYSKEAHASIVQMYVMDERFKSYYENIYPGAAEFLRDAVSYYLEGKDDQDEN